MKVAIALYATLQCIGLRLNNIHKKFNFTNVAIANIESLQIAVS